MKILEFTVFCKPDSFWQQKMLVSFGLYFCFLTMNTSELVNINTAAAKKTRASKRRKDTSQVCRCTRASLCFWYLKRHFCLWVGAHELTAWHLKMFVFVWPAGRFGARGKSSIPPFCFLIYTDRGWQELQQQHTGPWANTDFGNPKGIWHHPHLISLLSGLWRISDILVLVGSFMGKLILAKNNFK